MPSARLPQLDTESLRSKLKLRKITSNATLLAHHPHIHKLLASGILTGTLLLSPGNSLTIQGGLPPASQIIESSSLDLTLNLSDKLTTALPSEVGPLTDSQESAVSQVVHDLYGLHASATLEGNHLNQSYGLIGAEQHLPRFPGDTAEQHGSFVVNGITPGRGAWGYFAQSKDQLTPGLVEKERYYVAVQTLYLPDWTTRLAYLRDWYKYRKVVVLNPNNGRAVVAVVADSGPAAWTGKHFGGSPEVMSELRLNVGKQKGAVVLFFVDDPDDQVPLGPLEYNLEKIKVAS